MIIYPLLPIVLIVVASIFGFLLLTRKGNKPATYALGAAAVVQGGMALCLSLSLRDFPSTIDIAYLKGALVLTSLCPVFMILFTLHHFRTTTFFFPIIKKVSLPAFSIMGVGLSLFSFHPTFLREAVLTDGRWTLHFGPLATLFCIYLILIILVILFQMEQTLRTTQALQRHHLSFMLMGISSGCLYSLFIASILLLYHSISLDFLLAGTLVYTISWGMLAFAVVRYSLLDVSIFISRHVVFSSISAFGVSLYLIVMGIAGYILRSIAGQWDLFLITVFVSFTLIILFVILLSSTLQKKLRYFINRHFYRYKYDYRLEWNEFTKKISSVKDLPNLLLKIIEMISDTFWVNQISVWLYNEQSGILSFSRSRNLPRKAEFLKKETPLVQYLLQNSAPLDANIPESQDIINRHQGLFNRFNIALIVPLKIGDRLLGMITLGAEMKGADYTNEDYELLMTIALQASSAILGAQLIEEISVTKETESFNKISSFLVHDLKNLVSSLSLVLQNAERNIAKPEFQQDLLFTLQDNIEKMKALIEKLSTLPKELDIKKNPVDINRLVTESLESSKIKNIKGIELTKDLNDLPTILADGEYVKKVLVNLILNSVQSLPEGKGRIEVASYIKDGYAVVEVLDSGTGMTEEFIQKQLFKPFTSTKKKGLGIGLYQCKAIMEAHGGSIEAGSIPDRGSQFLLKFLIQ